MPKSISDIKYGKQAIKNGPEMEAKLKELGIQTRENVRIHAVRDRRTGDFNVDFHSPNVQTSVEPSKHWKSIVEGLADGLQVVDTADFTRMSDPNWNLIASLKIKQVGEVQSRLKKIAAHVNAQLWEAYGDYIQETYFRSEE